MKDQDLSGLNDSAFITDAKQKLEPLFTDTSNGITESEEYDLCNILGTHDCRHFINVLLFDKGSYSISIVKAIRGYSYLNDRYILPLHLTPTH